MAFSHFGITEPLNSGYDFYTADAAQGIQASLSASLNVDSVPILKISYASVSISNLLSVDISAVFERQDGVIEISASTTVTVNMYKEAYASSAISSNASVDSSLTKISFAQVNLSSSLNLSIQVLDVVLASSALLASASVSANIIKIAFASVSISNILDVNLVAVFERQDGSVAISANVSVACNATKISYAQQDVLVSVSSSEMTVNILRIAIASTSISSSLSVNQVPFLKISKVNLDISANATVLSNASRIAFIAAAFSSHLDLSIAGKLFLMTIRINILNNTNVVSRIVRYQPSSGGSEVLDAQEIRTLLSIDNRIITNHNRVLQSSIEPVFIENKSVNNIRSRYYKSTARASRKVFAISWSYLPNSKEKTVDQRWGRDHILSIANDPDYHVLKITNMDSSGVAPPTETSYNVLVTDYNETLIRRDIADDTYYWDCSITLGEV